MAPSPDNYIEIIDEGRILRLDPLGTYEIPAVEPDALADAFT
ncbi:hypothetical protein [Caballeronia sp.]